VPEARQRGPGPFVVSGGIAVVLALAAWYLARDRAAFADEVFWASAAVGAWSLQALCSFAVAIALALGPVARAVRVLVSVTPLACVVVGCALGGVLPYGSGIVVVWFPLAIVAGLFVITGYLGAR
jgi:hypothetical protein